MNNDLLEAIKIFLKYQETVFEKESIGKKSKKYIEGYLDCIQDINNLVDLENSKLKKG